MIVRRGCTNAALVADITILLALSVFQTIVNANLPPTSDAVPLLGILVHCDPKSSTPNSWR